MTKKILSLNNRSVYFVFLISYIAILLIAMTSSFIFYSKINKTISKQTQRSNIALLDQLTIDFENKVLNINDTRDRVIFNRKLEMFAKGLSTYSYGELMNDLDSYKQPAFFADYFIYLTQTDEIVTSTIRMKSKFFFNLMYSVSPGDYEEIKKEILSGYHMNSYLPRREMNIYDDKGISVIPYVQSFPINASAEPVGQLVILLDAEKMGELVSKFSWATDSCIYIFDKHNNMILSSGDALGIPEDLSESLSESPMIFDYKIDNQEVIITQNKSDQIGWRFVIMTPRHIYFEERNHFTLEAIGIFLIYLIGGLIMVCFFAKKNYKPLKEIKAIISSGTDGAHEYENEYEYIKHAMKNSFENDKAMKQRIRNQIPIIRNDCLLKLLKGYEMDDKNIEDWLRSVQIVFETGLFIVVNMEFDLKSKFFVENQLHLQENLSMTRLVMDNQGKELLEKHFINYLVNLESNQSVWLLSLRKNIDEKEALHQVEEDMKALMDFVNQEFQINMNIGMSTIQEGVIRIREGFDESKKAVEYGRIKGRNTIVCFSELTDINFEYYYPIDTEFQLIHLLKNSFYEESEKLIHTLFEINFVSKKISTYADKCLIYEISATFNKVINSLLVMQGEEPISNQSIMEEISSNMPIEVAKEKFIEMIDQVRQLSTRKIVGKTEKLVNSITTYILDAPSDVWLDLNYLSKEFDVTPQYISNIFKKYKNENIKDFISKIKLGTAKELLISTELSTKEISTRLGYANESGILRLFKKYEGMTPGVYRMNNKK